MQDLMYTIRLQVKKRELVDLLLMHSNKREERSSVSSGEIVAAVGSKECKNWQYIMR